MLAHTEAQRVYGTAKESHNKHTRNTLKHSTYSHKWWEPLKCSISGVKHSVPALRGSRDGLVVAPAEKASLLGSKFDSKHCCDQFVTPLSCFLQPRCKILWPSKLVVLCLLLDLDIFVGVDPLCVFPLFLKKVADIIVLKLSIMFHWLICLGSFPECWWSANVTAIPKGALSPDKENY